MFMLTALRQNAKRMLRKRCRQMADSVQLTLLISLALMVSFAQAQHQRCVDSDGKVTYTDRVCPKSTAKQADVKITDNTADFSEYRNRAQQQTRRPSEPEVPSNTAASNISGYHQCEVAKKNLQTASNSIRPNLSSIAEARLAVMDHCGTARSACTTTSIAGSGPFLGNHGEVLKLLDGTVWKIDSYEYLYLYLYGETVKLCPTSGFLIVGKHKIRVAPL